MKWAKYGPKVSPQKTHHKHDKECQGACHGHQKVGSHHGSTEDGGARLEAEAAKGEAKAAKEESVKGQVAKEEAVKDDKAMQSNSTFAQIIDQPKGILDEGVDPVHDKIFQKYDYEKKKFLPGLHAF